jgi:hypothetical protein
MDLSPKAREAAKLAVEHIVAELAGLAKPEEAPVELPLSTSA